MTNATLTVTDIESAYNDDRWQGWGYLGERFRMADDLAERIVEAGPVESGLIDAADAVVLRFAVALGWDAEDLFHWCNSKDGRYFGDWAFGCDTATEPTWLPSLFPTRPVR